MAQGKPAHYWRQLRAALTAGQWDARFPAKDVHGRAVSWSDLLRKFNKHCPGHQDVAELASQTHALSLLLSANTADLDACDAGAQGALLLGEECMLAEERVEEGLTGYNTLKQLDASASDSVKAALAYYAYALRRPSECLEHLAQVKDLSDAQGPVFSSPTTSSAPATLRVPGTSSNASLSSSWTGSFVSAQSSSSVANIDEGRTWSVVEQIRSVCLKGMCYETMNASDIQRAFTTYTSAIALIASVVAEIPAHIPTAATGAPTSPDNTSFTRYRELWRWVERVLRRGVILGARICDVSRTDGQNGAFWTLLQQYHTCSAHWPPSFRPEQRSTVAVLHLRALIFKARSSPPPKPGADRPHRWISAARSVVQEYRAILSVSTSFPKAGERNVKVEDLVDLSVAAWEADGAVGEYAGWVIDVLWWATRLTFNSFKIFRHMSRLFYVSGDPELAKRTLRLYVQIVSKAREASLAEEESATPEATGAFGAGKDIDTDENWVQTLVQGSRMLSRLALADEDPGKAVEEAKEAGEMIEKAKTRLNASDAALVASVQIAEAIWHIAMAYTEQDVLTRTARFEQSLSLLHKSLETNPTPSTHHHLALAYLRPGASQDIQTAIVHARAAVEGDHSEPRHWHLLGLLLTATGDWRAAKEVLELGASVSEADLVDDEPEVPEGTAGNDDVPEGVRVHDYGTAPNGVNGDASVTSADSEADRVSSGTVETAVLDKEATELPPSSLLLQPLGDRPSPNRQEAFEHALQLRMTQLTLTEFVEGPEGTGDKWVEVFQWFSERREVGVEDRRMSIDSRRASQELKPASMTSSVEKRLTSSPNPAIRSSALFPPVEEQPEPGPTPSLDVRIPITVTPASPMAQSPAFSQDQLSRPSLNGTLREDGAGEKRLSVDDGHGNRGKGKKVREVFISGVHKGRARVTTISKKIGHNVGRHHHGAHLKRSTSAPAADFRALLGQTPYQASSIHLRQHLSIYTSQQDLSLLEAPPPPPPPPPPSTGPTIARHNARLAKDRRLLSNLWLMSSATFRRLGKIEQARGAIQEAEVRDEANPAVWVQLGLYYLALDEDRKALEAFQKALFIAPNDVSATIHLCRVYLSAIQDGSKSRLRVGLEPSDRDNVDLAVGLLSALTKGAGWDVPEAWYFLAKMYGLQGRKDRERECLCFALTLSENRPLRDPGIAVGWCL
ncbi:hypothetical protein C8Q77DRAFT_1061722 [Trametes polyzona]|nr:hypothetical protein C8Q77DRAFT_1061722 [Trametes polyzona]